MTENPNNKLTKAEFRALEKIFAAEIENRLLFQSRAAIFNRLQDEGLVSSGAENEHV